MKQGSVLRMFVVAACFAMMAACSAALDQPGQEEQQPLVEELSSELEDGAMITSTPEGAVVEPPDGESVDNEFTGEGEDESLACWVDLLFCRDSRFGGLPSACSNGGCTLSQAHNAAVSLCEDICGNIDCSVIAWPAGCL